MSIMIDPKIYFQNDTELFDNHPIWYASDGDVKPNTYIVPSNDHSVVLISKDQTFGCIGNICTHKNAIIFKDRGSIGSVITCPIHKWSWEKDGNIRGARGFDTNCSMDLPRYGLTGWNGNIFRKIHDRLDDTFDKLNGLEKWLNPSKLEWHSSQTIDYKFDWKIFMEIFLDLYHIKTYHPTLRELSDCNNFEWKFGKHWVCQTSGFNHTKPIGNIQKEIYDIYQDMNYHQTEPYGAVWFGLYPATMIEHYPGGIVISSIRSTGIGTCRNFLEFYYDSDLLKKHPNFPSLHQEAFMKTADEDEEIGLRMQEGLSLKKETFVSKDHPIEEAGYAHFHNWLKTNFYPGIATK